MGLHVSFKDYLNSNSQLSVSEALSWIEKSLKKLELSRPTAVTLSNALNTIRGSLNNKVPEPVTLAGIGTCLQKEAEDLLLQDANDNKKISVNGFNYLLSQFCGPMKHIGDITPDIDSMKKLKVLTHCNTGVLATSKYGTALGIIRELHRLGKLENVYATETRPYNQGSRLTAFELSYDKIPVTLIVDSAASYIIKTMNIDCVIVGADRICMNGDTANKIGTYQLAITAKHHGIPFMVAASFNAIDRQMKSGESIEIEERKPDEILFDKRTGQNLAYKGDVSVRNPAFDVTPADLITCIVTERGVFFPETVPPDPHKGSRLQTAFKFV